MNRGIWPRARLNWPRGGLLGSPKPSRVLRGHFGGRESEAQLRARLGGADDGDGAAVARSNVRDQGEAEAVARWDAVQVVRSGRGRETLEQSWLDFPGDARSVVFDIDDDGVSGAFHVEGD